MLLILASLIVFAAIFSLILGLSWRKESLLDSRMASLRGEEQVQMTYRMAIKQEPVGTRVIGPLLNALGRRLEVLLPTSWVRGLEKDLITAGEPVTLKGFLAASFLTVATLLLFGFTILTASNLQPAYGMAALAVSGFIGLYLPKAWLNSRMRMRQKILIKSLPDAFDLITTCVEAGLGLDAALARVAEKVEGPFAEELTITLREIPPSASCAATPCASWPSVARWTTSRRSSMPLSRPNPWEPVSRRCCEFRRSSCGFAGANEPSV